MPYKRKQPTPGSVQFNKFLAELPEKRLQGAKEKNSGLDADAKTRMK